MNNPELVKQFLVWLAGSHSPATVKSYHFALSSLLRYLSEIGKTLPECSLDDLTHYLVWLENLGLRSSTRAIYVTALKTMWQWLRRQNRVPFAEDLIPSPQAIDKQSYPFLEPAEFRSLLGALDDFYPRGQRNKAILAFLYATGVRLGELLSLNVADIDMDKMVGIVRTFKRKNHKREIYWDAETNALLKRWLETRTHVLVSESMGCCEALWVSLDTSKPPSRLERCAVQRMFRDLRERTGMEKQITPHSCRHGFGYRGVRANANLRYLQVMMGHASLKTTTIYMGYKNAEVEEEYRKLFQPEVLTVRSRKDTMLPYDRKTEKPEIDRSGRRRLEVGARFSPHRQTQRYAGKCRVPDCEAVL